ncbi:hypothetical protein FHX05_006081, partial [Rhizobium sp. BK491]|nr:hypothetical protein [Rhizobium sp. BK491]
MKKIFALALFVLASPFGAQAATLTFPGDKPVASITIPDSWKPEETDGGVQGTSDDSAVYLSVEVANGKSMEKVVTGAIDFLAKNKVTIDPSTQKETP